LEKKYASSATGIPNSGAIGLVVRGVYMVKPPPVSENFFNAGDGGEPHFKSRNPVGVSANAETLIKATTRAARNRFTLRPPARLTRYSLLLMRLPGAFVSVVIRSS
jgi:hypothetical protein